MAFTPGTWRAAPTNGTRGFSLTFLRCVTWATYAYSQCQQWVTSVTQSCLTWVSQAITSCLSWGSTTSSSCCTWWPCSWLCDIVVVIITAVCLVVSVVVAVVCVVFEIIVIVACALMVLIVSVVCLLWSLVSIIFGASSANGGTALLLTDGTVMVQECHHGFGTRRWWKLTPDNLGNYANGSWSRLADSNVGRKYFASAVLADGRVVVCGGEYSDASGSDQGDDTNACEIYDPLADTWTVFAGPMTPGPNPVAWPQIGDSPCVVLPDGSFLLGQFSGGGNVAKLDPATLTWSAMNARTNRSAEESWVLMSDNTIVSVNCDNPPGTWLYNIGTDAWSASTNLPTSIVLPPPGAVSEIGPALLRYDGTAFFVGGNQHTAVYTAAATPPWTNGPDLPALNGQNLGVLDGPGVILPNGNILFGAGPLDAKNNFNSPSNFFEFDGTTFNRTSDPPNSGCPTYVTRLLLLPNADVLFTREDDASMQLYTAPTAVPPDAFRPVIQHCPGQINRGATITIDGTQFNGLSQGTAYGDDSAAATNYPLVRLTNAKTGQVRYCRTSGHSSMGVATGPGVISTQAAIPGDIDLGGATLELVANGIPSLPFEVVLSQ